MEPRRYRLNRPTLGVCSARDKKICTTVPVNAIIEVQMPDILESKQTVQITWCDRVLTMFTEDILERGTPIDDPLVENSSPPLAKLRAARFYCRRGPSTRLQPNNFPLTGYSHFALIFSLLRVRASEP
jgi:hypothetical protein